MPQFEVDLQVEGVSQDAILQDKEKSCKSYKFRSGTKSIRNDLSKGNMIFSEEPSRALCEMGARTRGIEHVSMRRLASTQSKYDGLNQNSFCSVENSILPCLSNHVKRKEKWTQPMADGSSKSHGCKKRSDETRRIHLFLDRWQNDEVCRAFQLVHGWIEELVKSTTSPRLTSDMMHLTDSDYDMKAQSI